RSVVFPDATSRYGSGKPVVSIASSGTDSSAKPVRNGVAAKFPDIVSSPASCVPLLFANGVVKAAPALIGRHGDKGFSRFFDLSPLLQHGEEILFHLIIPMKTEGFPVGITDFPAFDGFAESNLSKPHIGRQLHDMAAIGGVFLWSLRFDLDDM